MAKDTAKQALQTYFTKPWYLNVWFIGLLYALSIFIIPLIPAIVLSVLSQQDTNKKKQLVKDLNLDKLANLKLLEKQIEEKHNHDQTLDTLKEAEDILAKEQAQLQQTKSEAADATNKLIAAQAELEMQEYGFYGLEFDLDTSAEYKAKMIALQDQQKRMVKENTACLQHGDFTFNNSRAEGRRVIKKQTKLALWAFNSHCDNVITNVTYRNYEVSEKKIRRAFEVINESNSLIVISEPYLALKLQELDATFKFKEIKEREKETLRAQRAEEREEKKLQLEIAKERQKIEKDEQHVNAELARLQKVVREGKGKNKELQDEVAALESKLTDLDEQKKSVDYREANSKAGYVYVISNIGAFGDGVVKIGVTRRLEPLERINELGDASVPFRFDIHALIFSDDAYALEYKLHERFKKQRINRVNSRKEFFSVPIEAMKMAITEEFKSAEFTTEAPAREFRQSQAKQKVKSAKGK